MLDDLTSAQRDAVLHEHGPLLIVAGAGTGKTTVITRRIAWLLTTRRAQPEEILALTFTEKAAAEMQERVDVLVPYGYLNVALRTFHAFGDQLLRDHALAIGRSSQFRVIAPAEQRIVLRQHLFELPLERLRPLHDPTRFLEALVTLFARAKDEAVTPAELLDYALHLQESSASHPEDAAGTLNAARWLEIARCYDVYETLLREADLVDFGDQVLLAIRVLEQRLDVLA